MTSVPSARDSLLRYVSNLSEDEAQDLLDSLALSDEPGELSEEDVRRVLEGRDAIARGDFVTLEELKAEIGR
jgi:hypothetical protein